MTLALVIKKDGAPVGGRVLAAIIGWLMAVHGYEGEIVELDDAQRKAA